MIKAYNFLASWQLFPEKGTYEYGDRPRSGLYRIEAVKEKILTIHHSWVSMENNGFTASYTLPADGDRQPFPDTEFADEALVELEDAIQFGIRFFRSGEQVMHVLHEIMPNGYLRVMQQGYRPNGSAYTNTEFYHKQMSVLPYAASVSGAVIRPTEQGIIKHKALTAMEEQTNMQLDQIRQQIELLALQAQQIQQRKELSMMIYQASLSFTPVIGHTYYLYEKKDESFVLSLISPKEWGGGSGPFKRCVAAVQLLADHTWKEI